MVSAAFFPPRTHIKYARCVTRAIFFVFAAAFSHLLQFTFKPEADFMSLWGTSNVPNESKADAQIKPSSLMSSQWRTTNHNNIDGSCYI